MKALTKKKNVNDAVNKVWADQARKILTGSHQEVNQLFTGLLTVQNEHSQEQKTDANRERLAKATKALMDCAKYGWYFGISAGAEDKVKFTRPKPDTVHPRVKALLSLAVEAGRKIGDAQLMAIRRRRHAAEHLARLDNHDMEHGKPAGE